MTVTTLVIPEAIGDALLVAAREPLESAAVLLAHPVPALAAKALRLLAHSVHWVPTNMYDRREHDALSIRSEGYVHALREAEATNSVPIFLHTHPGDGASPMPSIHDSHVDRELADLFRLRSGSDIYASVVIAHSGDTLTFTGRLLDDTETWSLNRLWLVGARWRLTLSHDSQGKVSVDERFDRNVRAFGGGVQRVLQDLRITIVGCGGTGSAVAEQLVRLGVRALDLVDADTLSASNVTRVYGSTPADVGRSKTAVLADHLRRIAPDATITAHTSMITMEPAARSLLPSDLIFACTDDNAGRLVLSRYASYMLTPVIDCGVLLSSNADGVLAGIDGRITVLAPGLPCLVCRGRIDLQRANAELLTPDERVRLADEGYAPALGQIDPAVVPFTTLVSAVAVSELLERLIHYGPDPEPSEILVRCHDREISTNLASPKERHYCHPDNHKLGLGLTEPFLEQTWPG